MGIDIFVICGLSPFKIIRGDFKSVKFSFSEEQNPRKVVVGLIGMNMFHHINQEDQDAYSWVVLDENSVYFGLDELVSGAESNESIRNRRSLVNTGEDNVELVSDEEELVESGRSDEEIVAATSNTVVPEPAIDSTSVRDFVDGNFVINPNDDFTIEEGAYNTSVKINFEASQAQEFHSNRINCIKQIYDIDGFFGAYKWKNHKVFKGNAKIVSNPSTKCIRELKSFKKICSDSGINVENNVILIKIADLLTNFGHFDFFYSGIVRGDIEINQFESQINFAVFESFKYAGNAECINPVTRQSSHPGCRFWKFKKNIDAHRPRKKNRSEQLEGRRFACFCFHFAKELNRRLNEFQVFLSEEMAYVQMVGTKGTLFSNTIDGLSIHVNLINEYFNLDRMEAFFDFSVSTIFTLTDESVKVKFFLFLYIFICF